jgi:hypothetical protein
MLLLDSEALSAMSHGPADRRDRVRALMGEMRARGLPIATVAAGFAEVVRGRAADAALFADRRGERVEVRPVDTPVGVRAGQLLGSGRAGSELAIDAFIVAVADLAGGAVSPPPTPATCRGWRPTGPTWSSLRSIREGSDQPWPRHAETSPRHVRVAHRRIFVHGAVGQRWAPGPDRMTDAAKPSKKAVVAALLDRYGETYAAEAGIRVEKNTPSPLFRLLCLSLLQSARISSDIAMRAAKGLAGRGWRTAERMADSTWKQRVDALNEAGYTRYQERTSTMLEDTARLLVDRWKRDLRKLREEAERDPAAERKLLKAFKGMGEVGVDIFFREVQLAWDELRPFADRRALSSAQRLGLGESAEALARRVVRVELAGEHEAVLAAAR